MSQQKVVLVTGVSSGIGRAIARRLADSGMTVYGTSRRPSEVEPIPGVELLPLDVRSDESVAACVEAAIERAGPIDVLINNAGYAMAGPLEAVSLEEARAQFETNFWGVVRMVNAVLPGMRAVRAGRIINISSVAGQVPIPFLGFYSASKFALEGYSEALRHELEPLGIQVSLVEPGFIRTGLTETALHAADRIRDYDPWRGRALGAVERQVKAAPDASLVAATISDIVGNRSPRLRYRVGREARRVLALRRLVPDRVFGRALRRTFDL